MYVADKKTKQQFDELNKIIDKKDAELKEKTLRILSLENNQSSKHICSKKNINLYYKGVVIYTIPNYDIIKGWSFIPSLLL